MRSAFRLTVAATLLGGSVLVTPATAAPQTITSRGPAAVVTYAADSTTSITASPPEGTRPGDVLLASLAFGRTGAKSQPVLTAPPGWTLVTRTNHTNSDALAVFSHVVVAGDAPYGWTTSVAVGAIVQVSAFGGVDATHPVDVSAGRDQPKPSSTVTSPSVTTRTAGAMLVASFQASKPGAPATWTAPDGMTEIGEGAVDGRSASTHIALQQTAGASGGLPATISTAQDDGIAILTALRPGEAPPASPVPLIVDTDLFSSADDAGALAIAFALQLRGAANVLAIGVNTRLSRTAVATDSWRCAAALAHFYGFDGVPIGAGMPNDGTETNAPDFIAPCAALAPDATPTPPSAVSVFRQALAAQPDGSVVFASVGYSTNLAALLASPADAVSNRSGKDLVRDKVRTLVIMGGRYPNGPGENNLAGNPAAAQKVTNDWPTKIVWSGSEVGDAVHTGNTVSATHPAWSPLRVAYQAFVGPNNWIYSYDLTAVYHAIRPTDPLLIEVGPGKNTIDPAGKNTFKLGGGNQYYLTLTDVDGLDDAIESLLDRFPVVIGPGPNDAFDSGTLSPATWTVSQNGSTVAAAEAELQITHPGGDWTTGSIQSAVAHDQTGKSLALQVKRAASAGQGGPGFGETSVLLWLDASHYASFFIGGASFTAWVSSGSGEVNLTPAWPAYDPVAMQWVRFRESGGTLFWEYATAPGTWTTLASAPDPFPLTAVTLKIVAGSNAGGTDTARFDNVSTS